MRGVGMMWKNFCKQAFCFVLFFLSMAFAQLLRDGDISPREWAAAGAMSVLLQLLALSRKRQSKIWVALPTAAGMVMYIAILMIFERQTLLPELPFKLVTLFILSVLSVAVTVLYRALYRADTD